MTRSATRRLVGLALVACIAMAMRPALACGVFSRAMSEAEIAGKLPYLSVERVLLAWDPATGLEDFVREVRFERASQAFGFVVPVPSTPEVSGIEGSPFDAIAAAFPFQESTGGGIGGGRGRGGPVSGAADEGVTVLATKRIGSFTSFIIAATDGGGLAAWLASNGFDARDAGKDWLQHYVRLGFTFVALRYDGPPAGSAPTMTSQTVRIRFRTPLPYYPYQEPAQTDAPQAPREFEVWMASPRPFVPVAAYRPADGPVEWRRPWKAGAAFEVTARRLTEVVSTAAGLFGGDPDARWTFVPMRDEKRVRDGPMAKWGDVLLVPADPVAADDAAIAARWSLLPVLDPRLEGSLDRSPMSASSLAPLTQTAPLPSTAPSTATPPSLPSAQPSSTSGCSLAAAAEPGYGGGAGVATACAACIVLIVRRRRSTAAALVALATLAGIACKGSPGAQTSSLDAAASPLEPEPHTLDRSSDVVAFSVDGTRLLVARGASLSAFEMATGKELWTTEVERSDSGSPARISRLIPLRTPAPTAAGSVLVDWYSPAEDGSVLSFVEVDSGRIAWRSTQEVHGANVFAVSPDGRWALAIGWNPPTARVWDVSSHSLVRELPVPATLVRSAAFLDDGHVVGEAMTLDGDALRAWDVLTGAQPLTIPIPPVNLRSLVASGDGGRIAALTDDLQLRVWDARSGREIRSFDLSGHSIPDAVTFTRDGSRLYSLDESGLYAWDVDAGLRLDCGGLVPEKAGFQSHSLVLSPDEHLAVMGGGTSIPSWRVPPGPGSRSVAWPSVPPWSPLNLSPRSAPAPDADPRAQEMAVLGLMLGHAVAGRLPEDSAVVGAEPTVSVREAALAIEGDASADVVRRFLRQQVGRFRLCYEHGIETHPHLAGRVSVRFVVDAAGAVNEATDAGSELADAAVVSCITRAFGNLTFPPPTKGTPAVTYAMALSQREAGTRVVSGRGR